MILKIPKITFSNCIMCFHPLKRTCIFVQFSLLFYLINWHYRYNIQYFYVKSRYLLWVLLCTSIFPSYSITMFKPRVIKLYSVFHLVACCYKLQEQVREWGRMLPNVNEQVYNSASSMNVSALFDNEDNSHYPTLLASFVLIWLWDPKQQNVHSVHLLKGCDR